MIYLGVDALVFSCNCSLVHAINFEKSSVIITLNLPSSFPVSFPVVPITQNSVPFVIIPQLLGVLSLVDLSLCISVWEVPSDTFQARWFSLAVFGRLTCPSKAPSTGLSWWGPVVTASPSTIGGVGLTHGRGTRIPQASWPRKPKHKT